MSSLVVDLGPLSTINGHFQGRKQAKASAKDRERSCFRLQRLIIGRRIGTLIACLISALSLLILLNVTSRFSSPSSIPARDDNLSSDMAFTEQRHNLSLADVWVSLPPPVATRVERIKGQIISPMQRVENQHLMSSLLSSDHPLPVDHPCHGFTLPPPPVDKKRTGPRPCPVCYVPVEKAIKEMPTSSSLDSLAIKELSYVEEPPIFSLGDNVLGRQFGGHPSLEDRVRSYQIQEHMKIHCGFAQGSGFDMDVADRREMDKCTGIVVASAIFGNYDQLQQPINISDQSRRSVCFFMFVDEETKGHLDVQEIENGVWSVVVVHNLPYEDARRNGKIPKLLLHRLFPNARFSLWIDGKLKLVVDPYQILERFLWRRNFSLAISRHYRRFDVFEEAEANKAAGKYDNASINFQVEFYKSEGLVQYNSAESLFPSDVPEGCVIVREHTPITNLFTCLWFNEVDRFTSRDQLSFAIVRDYLMERVPFRLSMFLDCERRNFVVQGYHRDLLEQRNSALQSTPAKVFSGTQHHPPPTPPPVVLSRNVPNSVRGNPSRSHGRHRRGGASRRRAGSRAAGRSV